MCEPTTILTALAIGSATVGTAGQARTARSTRRTLSTQAAAQQEEIEAQKALAAGERTKEARAERARMVVAAGEAGVSGVSVDDALFDVYLQEDLDLGILAKDSEFAMRASDARLHAGLAANRGPSALETGLNIAGAGYEGYTAGLQIRDRRKEPTP